MSWNRRALRWGVLGVVAVMMSGCCVMPFGRVHGGYYQGGYSQGGQGGYYQGGYGRSGGYVQGGVEIGVQRDGGRWR